ncbi:MAG: succinate--CoA ligase subunit alpha [Desulfurococcaceae archaeon]|nr:succinate--CoA ligase subunit alpha [Desulfurococcaceae archaeon]
MGILVNSSTRVLVQGITGREGSFHTKLMLEYGTKIVAGTSPGKGGSYVHGVPVYNTVYEAVREQGPVDASIVFVPARSASDAVYEAIDHGVKVVVVITEGIPLHDEIKFVNYARSRGVNIVGPNTPGVMTVGECKLGIMPAHVFKRGSVGLVSRSGTLTYEIARELSKHNYGVSTVVGLGGDPITGLDFIDVYKMFLEDKETEAVVLIGEIGGDAEERFADYYSKLSVKKPVVAYIAGRTAPPGKRMGHAGAIISMGMGDYKSKRSSLESAGIPVAETPSQVPLLLREVLRK